MDKIIAAIVDDEKHASETLIWELERACPEVEIKAVFRSPQKALEELPKLDIQLLFLDVEMPKMNGFELLNELNSPQFGVIFTTAYDQFALKAIKHSAIDYILKPVDSGELKSAVDKFKKLQQKALSNEQLELLFSKVSGGGNEFGKIALPSSTGLLFVEPSQIIQCQSESNYTVVYFSNGKKHVISKTLKEIESLLDGQGFMRVHHSHIINLKHVSQYVKKEGGYLVLDDGSHISVSRSRKDDLLALFS